MDLIEMIEKARRALDPPMTSGHPAYRMASSDETELMRKVSLALYDLDGRMWLVGAGDRPGQLRLTYTERTDAD